MEKQYIFKINKINDNFLLKLKNYLNDNSIEFYFEETNIENDKSVILYYVNNHIDNCVGFNNIIDIDRFIEVYPTITPMYSFNVVGGFTLLNNYVGKELTEEIVVYCKRLYNDKIR